jgi:hypothetical protein
MKVRAIFALVAALFFGGMSIAFAQAVHEKSGCYDSNGQHVRC